MFDFHSLHEVYMRSLIMWLLGVPISIIILYNLFF